MFSCASPAKLASSCNVNSAALTTPSSSSTSCARRSTISVMTCQASGESRSRKDVAVRWAERTSDSAEPNLSGLCSASATILAGLRPRGLRRRAPGHQQAAGCARPTADAADGPLPGSRVGVPAPGSAATSPRRAPDSGRARTDCRRRGSAPRRRCAGSAPCRPPAAASRSRPPCRIPPRHPRPARRRPSTPRGRQAARRSGRSRRA